MWYYIFSTWCVSREGKPSQSVYCHRACKTERKICYERKRLREPQIKKKVLGDKPFRPPDCRNQLAPLACRPPPLPESAAGAASRPALPPGPAPSAGPHLSAPTGGTPTAGRTAPGPARPRRRSAGVGLPHWPRRQRRSGQRAESPAAPAERWRRAAAAAPGASARVRAAPQPRVNLSRGAPAVTRPQRLLGGRPGQSRSPTRTVPPRSGQPPPGPVAARPGPPPHSLPSPVRAYSVTRETAMLTGTLRSLKAVVMKQPKVSAAITLKEKAKSELARESTVFIAPLALPGCSRGSQGARLQRGRRRWDAAAGSGGKGAPAASGGERLRREPARPGRGRALRHRAAPHRTARACVSRRPCGGAGPGAGAVRRSASARASRTRERRERCALGLPHDAGD